jgi:hypothetical protein
MTTPGPYPSGVDPVHVLAICAEAAPGTHRDTAILVGGRHAACVYLPTRRAARAAQAGLCRVGYQADRPTGNTRGRDLIIHGWSAGALEARLIAMRAVLEQLAANPVSTATTVLDKLRGIPLAELPGEAHRQQLIAQAAGQLRRWIFTGSGIQVPHDPRLRPADTGCALRVSAAWQLEEAIDDVAARHIRVARYAIDLYPASRQQLGHDGGRDSAIRRAAIAFHLRSRPVTQDTSPLLATSGQAPDATPAPEARTRFQPGSQPAAREFPVTGGAVSSASRISLLGPDRLSGRNFPSGRSGPHP